jgi:hypothetical protein
MGYVQVLQLYVLGHNRTHELVITQQLQLQHVLLALQASQPGRLLTP